MAFPRHREVGEGLTEQIYRECQPKLGEGLVEAMSRFTAHVTQNGRFWLIHVPEIDRRTQARYLREIDTMARHLVAVMTGEDRSLKRVKTSHGVAPSRGRR